MSCCVCGRDVAGIPVMRDNETGYECCEDCGRVLGGPAGFIKYVESLKNCKLDPLYVMCDKVMQQREKTAKRRWWQFWK